MFHRIAGASDTFEVSVKNKEPYLPQQNNHVMKKDLVLGTFGPAAVGKPIGNATFLYPEAGSCRPEKKCGGGPEVGRIPKPKSGECRGSGATGRR